MRRLTTLHALAFVFVWMFTLVGGPARVPAVTGALVALQLVLWRLDLVQLGHLRGLSLSRRRPARSIPSYERVRAAIGGATHSPREFDLGIRRTLERIASTRLSAGHGVDMHRDPDAARRLLGPQTWTLLDPTRTTSVDVDGPSVSTERLTEIVDRLERL